VTDKVTLEDVLCFGSVPCVYRVSTWQCRIKRMITWILARFLPTVFTP